MNAFFRHLAVRLWCTAFLGGFLGMALMPSLHRMFGLGWSVVPLMVILALVYVVVGWCMNRVAARLIAHRLNEASVWERAGMIPEAQAVFDKVASLLDSFWLSPRQRSNNEAQVSGRIARFYISQPTVPDHHRSMLATYLKRRSEDWSVAEAWLNHLLSRPSRTAVENDAADNLGSALSDHRGIQRLLFRFYLAEGRVDFNAIRCYRRVWRQHQDIAEAELASLAGLLLNDTRIDDWTLQVYLAAYDRGQEKCLEGIAAAVRQLPPNSENKMNLDAAGAILASSGYVEPEPLSLRFRQVAPAAPEPAESRHAAREIGRSLGRKGLHLSAVLLRGIPFLLRAVVGLVRAGFGFWKRSPVLRKATAMGCIGLLVIAVGVFVWRLRPASTPTTEPVPAHVPVETPEPVVTDPFTIQVAAYLNQEDAVAYVDRLKQAGLDAFRTKAASANRTWYQVKISHFATRGQAQVYGEQLKAKGIIDDFYVANYNRDK